MMVLRSALFNVAFWLWIAIIGLSTLPFAIIHRPFAQTAARAWASGSLFLLRVLCKITHDAQGLEHVPEGPAIIACKHQSAWDTIIFWILLKRPAYVLKRELIFYPIFGWHILLLKHVYIDRKSGATAIKRMLRESKARLSEGRPIIIFPEGTRTMPGATTTYHPGIAAIYHHLQLPVIPIALNSGLFWPRNSFIKKPGRVTLEVLPAIPPGMQGRAFLALLQERIESKSKELLEAARPTSAI